MAPLSSPTGMVRGAAKCESRYRVASVSKQGCVRCFVRWSTRVARFCPSDSFDSKIPQSVPTSINIFDCLTGTRILRYCARHTTSSALGPYFTCPLSLDGRQLLPYRDYGRFARHPSKKQDRKAPNHIHGNHRYYCRYALSLRAQVNGNHNRV